MGIPFLNNIIINSAGHVQFKTTAAADAGKIDQVNNDLVITNAVGDVLLGDGSSDVYIGDGVNNVDILFEQSGSIKADSGTSGVTLTLGSSNTGLVLTSGADIDVTANLDVTGNVLLSGNIVDTNTNESIQIGVNDVWFEGKHIHAEYGVWARSSSNGQRNMGIDGGSSFMGLYTNATEKVRIDTNGKVGINNTSPSKTLTVSQLGDSDGITINGYDDHSASQANLYVNSSGHTYLSQTTVNASGYLILAAENYLKLQAGTLVYTDDLVRVYDEGQLEFGSGGDYKFKYDNSSDVLNIHTNDNKGITISNAGAIKLNQYGSGSITGTATKNLAVDSSGNVIETDGSIIDGSGTANYVSKWSDANTLTDSVIYDNGTNVGIGTTAPGKTLDVNGDIRLLGTNQFLEGESPTTRLRNMTALPGGYIEPDTFNFRFDESATAYAGQSFAIGGTISQTTGTAISDATLKRLFTYTAGYINLNTHKDSNNNVVIELDGISVSNSANNQWKPYVFFHASASNVATMTIEVKNGAGNWETVENAIDCVDFYIRNGFYQTSQGILKGARFTFTNITGNSYLRMIGVIGKTHASYQWNVLKSGSKMFGDLDFGDTYRATFGDGEDLRILHESNNSYIHHTGAGNLYMKADTGNIEIINYTNDSDIVLSSDNGSGGATPYLTIDGSTTHAYFSNPGNVGIGTTTPERQLSLYSNNSETTPRFLIEQDGTGDAVMAFSLTSGQGWSMGIDNSLSDSFMIHNSSGGVDSSSQFTIDTSGNVGIGTTSPARNLHIHQNDSTLSYLQITNSTTGASGSDGVSFGITSDEVAVWNNRENTDTTISTNNTERLRITSAGNIGIGTTNPETPLHVLTNTTDNASAMLIQNGSTGDASIKFNISGDTYSIGIDNSDSDKFKLSYGAVGTNDRIVVDTSGNVGIGQASPRGKFDVDGEVYVTTPNGIDSLKISDLSVKIGDYDDANGYAFLHLDSQDFKFTTDSVEVMRITSSGNVGIGTTSPGEKLSVSPGDNVSAEIGKSLVGNIGLSGYAGFKHHSLSSSTSYALLQSSAGETFLNASSTESINFRINNSDKMILTSGGDFGIGTTSPQAKLEVGNCDSSGNIGDGNIAVKTNTNNTAVVIQEASGAEQWGLGVNSDGDFVLTDSGTERVRIDDNTGNFGIGTNAPAEKLVVSGSDDVSIRINSTKNGTWTTDQLLGAYEFYGNDASGAGAQIKGKIDCASLDQYGAGFHMRFFTTGGGVGTSAIERMRINSNGAVTIGKTAPSSYNTQGIELSPSGLGAFTRSGNVSLLVNRTGSDGQVVSIRNDNTTVGSISVSGSTTSYNTSSDYRLKENVVDMTGAIERIEQLKPKRFNFISNAEKTVDGFIAHEVQNIIPEAVLGEKDAVDEDGNPEFQGIDQSKIVPLLVGAIKELKAEIENLKLQIN